MSGIKNSCEDEKPPKMMTINVVRGGACPKKIFLSFAGLSKVVIFSWFPKLRRGGLLMTLVIEMYR